MTYEIFNQTTSQWVDILWAIKYEGMDGSRNDVDGPNAGRVIQNAMMDRDRLATKYKWNFTTIPLTLAQAASIEALLMPNGLLHPWDEYRLHGLLQQRNEDLCDQQTSGRGTGEVIFPHC